MVFIFILSFLKIILFKLTYESWINIEFCIFISSMRDKKIQAENWPWKSNAELFELCASWNFFVSFKISSHDFLLWQITKIQCMKYPNYGYSTHIQISIGLWLWWLFSWKFLWIVRVWVIRTNKRRRRKKIWVKKINSYIRCKLIKQTIALTAGPLNPISNAYHSNYSN